MGWLLCLLAPELHLNLQRVLCRNTFLILRSRTALMPASSR